MSLTDPQRVRDKTASASLPALRLEPRSVLHGIGRGFFCVWMVPPPLLEQIVQTFGREGASGFT